MIELVIVLAIMGILAVTVIPMYSKLQSKTQHSRNMSNMQIIQEAFVNYFYTMYAFGTPQYPPPPDSLMTDVWCNTPMDSTRNLQTPNGLKDISGNPIEAPQLWCWGGHCFGGSQKCLLCKSPRSAQTEM